MDGVDLGVGAPDDVEGVTDVVEMAVGEEDGVDPLLALLAVGCERVRQPRVDQQRRPVVQADAHSRVSEPGDFES